MQKRNKKGKSKTSKYPYIIHADSLRHQTAFPTHTHGLTDVGMPEFIIDPFAFGPKWNMFIINEAYSYFKKPENADKLKTILSGGIIKLTGKELIPKYGKDDGHIFCFREVTVQFEAIKEAYVISGPEIEPGMRFVQIWIEGDDFALKDEYYRGGVRWH